MSLSRLVFAPYDPRRDDEVEKLFREYSHKDFQLQAMGIAKASMAEFLKTTLLEAQSQNIILRDDGHLVGLISLQFLPWMSDHFGLRMYSIRHLLARSDSPLVHTRLLRVVIEELSDVDFLDCRVAVDDVYSAHALEVCAFRYVGTEIFLGQTLENSIPLRTPPGIDIYLCRREDRPPVLDIAAETHVHNRFVYDPNIHEKAAQSLYRKLVTHCFDAEPFQVLVARSEEGVEGFITFKMNRAFSRIVGMDCGSLDLIGVRPQTRSQGLGTALNRFALHQMAHKGARVAAVRTLASNYPALRTCFRTAFTVTSTTLHFHRWIQRPKITAQGVSPGTKNNLKFAQTLADR
jgi:GNAT superfamily N-acetyltransferase